MWGFLIIAAALSCGVTIVRMGLAHNEKIMRHNENMERIKRGYEPIGVNGEWVEEEDVKRIDETRLQ